MVCGNIIVTDIPTPLPAYVGALDMRTSALGFFDGAMVRTGVMLATHMQLHVSLLHR